MKWMTKTSMIAAVFFAVVVGFTAGMPGKAESALEVLKAKLAAIESISSPGEANSAELVIKLSAPATYTSYKTTAPLRLVIDFSQTTEGLISAPVHVNKGNFKTVTVSRYDTAAGVLTRMDIELVNDSEAVITPSPTNSGELRVSFPLIAATATSPVEGDTPGLLPAMSPRPPTSASDAAMRTLTSITANNNSINLNLDGAAGDFRTFRLNKPERYVVDLIDVKSGLATRLLPLNVAGVASARIGLYPDKTRIVFDSINGGFPEASAAKTGSTVVITLDAKTTYSNANTKLTSTRTEPPPDKVSVSFKEKPADNDAPLESSDARTGTSAKAAKSFGPSRVEMIDFQVVEGISRVSVKVKGDVLVDPPVKSPGFVTLTVKNSSLPKSLQRSLDSHSFISPVLRVTPLTVKTKKGNDTKIRIAMRETASFEFRQEGDMLFVDFKNPEGLTAEKLVAETTDRKLLASKAKASASGDSEISAELSQAQTGDSPVTTRDSSRNYKGRKVTLEFADAEVRKIFQLLSEVSNKNFVLGDDVTGNISLKLVNVPWDQALDIILDTKNLDKREDGNIILIKGKGKFKSLADEELEIKKTLAKGIELKTETFSVNYSTVAEIAAQFEKLKTSDRGQISLDARTSKVIVKDTPQALDDMRKLLAQLDVAERQVMIEARIVEATSTFTRSLGVNWGIHYSDVSAPYLGINRMDTSFGGLANAPPTTGASGQPGGTMGISFGTLGSNLSIDLRLNAAVSAGLIRIISSPKVATLNNKTAKITQGQQVPYTSSTSDKVETKFVEAALSLEVTPHINANGTIGMKIDAKNDSVGQATGGSTAPAINKKQATTEMLLRDGETTVIAGIFVDSDNDSDDGVPYLMDIPLLGNLFKSNSTTKVKTELLIFITPRILGGI
jgi:type IV pilus assembly protein PilQ